jgi:glycosyltransferase involved in cell wall biosynthesis
VDKVSVIIPTYNRRSWVTEAIDSVLAQKYQNFELIVVDDGSDDSTATALQRYAGRIGYVYVAHGGVSRARNIGIRLSRASLIAFLDSDDLWLPAKLQRQVEYMAAHPDCCLCYTDEIWIRRGVRVNQGHKHRKYTGQIFEKCLPLCLISPSSVLIRRELLHEMGSFDESYPVCEDYALWLRITARHPVAFLSEALIVKRGGHADQLSRREWGMDRYRVRALQSLLAEVILSPEQQLAARQELLRKSRILERGYSKHGRLCEVEEIRQILATFDEEPRD